MQKLGSKRTWNWLIVFVPVVALHVIALSCAIPNPEPHVETTVAPEQSWIENCAVEEPAPPGAHNLAQASKLWLSIEIESSYRVLYDDHRISSPP
jgi:hypothetical protein